MVILTQRFDAVLEIALNRPRSLNAINGELLAGLGAQLDAARADPEIRAVMIRGEGRGFCAGGDIRLFAQLLAEHGRVPPAMPGTLHEMIEKVRAVPKPVIAAVHGPCAGAGVSLVLACDLAIAADDAEFNTAYTRVGLSPDGSASYYLPRHVGMKRAAELFMAPRSLSAASALELGLINRVVPASQLLDAARAFAREMAAGPTEAYGRVKQLLDASWTSSLHDQLALESEHLVAASGTEDFREAVEAFASKREPKFRGR